MKQLRQLPLDTLNGLDLLPLACLRDTAARIGKANGIRFEHEFDDLDEYDIATLEFGEGTTPAAPPTVFALRAYRGAPDGVVDILLPASMAGSARLRPFAADIAHALHVPPQLIVWPDGPSTDTKQTGGARRRAS